MKELKSALPNLQEIAALQREWSTAKNYSTQYRVLRTWWPRISGAEMPKEHPELLYTRISYELLAKAYIEANTSLPEKITKNLEGSRQFNLLKITPHLRVMLQISIQHSQEQFPQQGEESMAQKIEKVRVNVNQFYLELFEAQVKAQLSDEQIAAVIEKKTGIRPSFKNIASYRCMYNMGRINGQRSVPSVKAKAVRPKRERAKKPMSAETKAKLKEYSAKKKAAIKGQKG